MCTVTWLHTDGGYHVLCNRDEKLTRKRSAPPALDTRNGVDVVAPIDCDSGGTWIATNDFGVTLCLLNGANLSGIEVAERSDALRSRGLLIPDLIGSRCLADLLPGIYGRDLTPFAPFTLLVLEPERSPLIVEWTGRQILFDLDADRHLPLTSSSVDGDGARIRRRQAYRQMVGPAPQPHFDSLLSFHRSHAFGPGPYSPCMHRNGAQTVSFTHVWVTESCAIMSHQPSAPCRPAPPISARLELHR